MTQHYRIVSSNLVTYKMLGNDALGALRDHLPFRVLLLVSIDNDATVDKYLYTLQVKSFFSKLET